MINIHELPLLKAYRLKAMMPKDIKSPNFNNVIISNNISIESTGRLMNHPLVYTNRRFIYYYMDFKYREKFRTKTIVKNILQERENYYEAISSVARVKPIKLFTQIKNKNHYHDLIYYNKLFFDNLSSIKYLKRCELYMDYFKHHINKEYFTPFKIKTVFIDIDGWFKSNIENAYINNPITMMMFLIRKKFDVFHSLGDINIILFTNHFLMRINPSECDRKILSLLRRELNKMFKDIDIDDTNLEDSKLDLLVEDQDMKEDIKASIDPRMNFTGDDPDKIINDIDNEEDAVTSDQEEELIKAVYNIKVDKNIPKNSKSLKRDEELKEAQKKIKYQGMTIEDIKSKTEDIIEIESNDVSDNISTLNENIKNVTFSNFEKTYNKHLMKKDFINIITDLNNKSIPMYIRDIKVEDTSDELNYKDTYTIQFEDAYRVRHSLTFDFPKLIDDKFLFIRGNKKFIMKQFALKPIVKTSPDAVQITTNYNKIFIYRIGDKITPKMEKLKKVLSKYRAGIILKSGNNLSINNNYRTTLDYDELARSYTTLETGLGNIVFNQKDMEESLNRLRIKTPKDCFCIGYIRGELTFVNLNTGLVEGTDIDLIDAIVSILPKELRDEFDSLKNSGKRFMYTYASIMNKQKLPLVIICGYTEGLTKTLNKANIRYSFYDKRPNISSNQNYIRFQDGYLVYDRYPFENSLLLNALELYPTRAYNFEEFDTKDPYLDIFESYFSARNLGAAIDNYYDFMIDPITREVLEELNYPTDFVSVLLFANALLTDNSYLNETDAANYRIRSNEILNGVLHKLISNAYRGYANTAMNKNPIKMSLPKDALIKAILSSPSVEEYSVLNPIYELEKLRAITPKGFNGTNLEESYTMDKRSYHHSMVGIMAMSTATDRNVGIVRKLTLEPNVTSARGYIKIEDNVDNLTDAQLFSPSELLTSNSATKDDPTRTSMATKQSSHIIPVKKSSPVLLSNGVEKAIHYNLSSDFTIVAKEDGKVIEVDEPSNIIIVQYKSGATQAIDLNPKIVKNSSSGFYISNKLRCDLKLGQTVKKNDVLASDSKFFSDDGLNGNRFNIGSLQKVAIMSSYSTYEDSAFITKKLSKDLASELVFMKDVVLGKNANIGHMVKIGDEVKIGDLLISFESSFDEDTVNKFLSSFDDDTVDQIKSISSIPIKSKIAGVIEDIKIYSTVDLDELSPSLKKIVSAHYTRVNKKKKVLDKYNSPNSVYKSGLLFTETTSKVKPSSDGKVKGKEVFDGVLIEFYIKYIDELTKGDKITYFSALKSIVSEIIPEGKEPYSLFRPDEEISSFIGPSAVLARQTPSIILNMFGNKIIVELKRKLKEIYYS